MTYKATHFFSKGLKRASDYVSSIAEHTKLTEHTFVILLAIIIGILGGYGAVVIQFAIHSFQELFWNGEFNLKTINAIEWYWKILIPLMGGVVVGLVIRFVAKDNTQIWVAILISQIDDSPTYIGNVIDIMYRKGDSHQ